MYKEKGVPQQKRGGPVRVKPKAVQILSILMNATWLSRLRCWLHHGNQMTEDIWEGQRTDSMTLERLAASPYILNMYASCVVGQILEYADNGSLHNLIITNQLLGKDKMPSIDKLCICVWVAEGVAAVHSIEKDNVPSLAHNDLESCQYVNVDGVYKLNDFGHAKFLAKIESTNKLCGTYNDDILLAVQLLVPCSGNFILVAFSQNSNNCSIARYDLMKPFPTTQWTKPKLIPTKWALSLVCLDK